MEHQKISVIIPTKNRPRDVIRCLESILIQTQLPDEIIIVDASDNEELGLEIKACFQAKNEIAYIRSQPGLTHQRNIGVEASSGDIVFFLDDDVILDKDFVTEIVAVFDSDPKKTIAGVYGNIVNPEREGNSPIYFILRTAYRALRNAIATIFFLPKTGSGRFRASGFPTYPYGADKVTKVECLPGGLTAYRSEILNQFKFDENLKGYSFLEDCDISYRVSRKYQNVYIPYAKLIHNSAPVARDSEYVRRKMLIENHYYLFKKNLPQTPRHRFAFYWSIVGLFVMEAVTAMVIRDIHGLKGLVDGIASIRGG